jgi:regulator of RNase E activity RraA
MEEVQSLGRTTGVRRWEAIMEHDEREALMEIMMERLYVPVVCDVLDALGYGYQAMHQRLRPLDPENCRFAGRARTIQWTEMMYVVEEDPYGAELEAMDSLQQGDVVVHSTDYKGNNAPWGELMTTAAVARGAVGCVCDSQARDCRKVMGLGFPVFCAGIRPVDSKSRSRVAAFDVPIMCGDVRVESGDYVFADFDGVVIIPASRLEEVVGGAVKKVELENKSREELRRGRKLRDVYEQYGVL